MQQYLVLDLPVRRQRQEIVSKKRVRYLQRIQFNNLSLTEKNIIRKTRKGIS